jgi:DNA polymerase-3 subunit epsilon
MLFSQPCAIVDLETTGGHITRDRITEIGVLLIDGDQVERFSSLVNPGQPIPPFIENMTGISDQMVAAAPDFAQLAPELLTRLQGRLLLAHNSRFDYGVLKNEFKRVGLNFQTETLCTVKLSRRLYPQHYKHNLDAIIARHQIELPARHRALADAEAVYRFLLSASAELGMQGVREAAQALMAVSDAPEGMDAETFDALPDVPGVFWVWDRAGLPLYVERASNIRRQVLAHFAGGKRREVQLSGQAGRIEWCETLGEFGAALLEIVKLKTLRPRLNPKGRMASEACTLCLVAGDDGWLRPRVLVADQLGTANVGEHFGLFRSARDAKKALMEIALAGGLCQRILGVERITSPKGRPCHGYCTGDCRGACIGGEAAHEHNARLKTALTGLALRDWPFPGAIAIVEHDAVTGAACEYLFDRWSYLGSRPRGEPAMPRTASFLDLDVVKLLNGYFRKPVEGTSLQPI